MKPFYTWFYPVDIQFGFPEKTKTNRTEPNRTENRILPNLASVRLTTDFMCLSIFICDVRAKPPSMYVFHYCTKESQIWLLNIGAEIVSFRLTYLLELPIHFQFSQSFLINFLHLQFFGFIRAQFICKTTYHAT